jgi:Tat protein secretion system quality control protein TatD with DNase activity
MDDHLPPESVITFDRNAHACSLEKGRASAAEMPRERLQTETDVPFAHPEGQKAIITFADLWAEPAVGVDPRRNGVARSSVRFASGALKKIVHALCLEGDRLRKMRAAQFVK